MLKIETEEGEGAKELKREEKEKMRDNRDK